MLGADFRVLFIPLLMYSYTQEARKAGTGPPFIIDAANKWPIEFMVPSVMISIPSDGSQPSSSVPTKNVIVFDFSAFTNKRDDLKNWKQFVINYLLSIALCYLIQKHWDHQRINDFTKD